MASPSPTSVSDSAPSSGSAPPPGAPIPPVRPPHAPHGSSPLPGPFGTPARVRGRAPDRGARRLTIVLSVLVHALAALAAVAYSFWHIEEVTPARVTVTFRNRRVVELMTTRSTERFANGLGVDSSEAQVRAAWPQVKCAAMPPFYRRCRLGTGAPGSRNTDFIFGTTHRAIYVIVTKLP